MEMTWHEKRAVRVIAARKRIRQDACTVVREPRPNTTYLFADPGSGKTGRCHFGPSGWEERPRGRKPVLFVYIERPRLTLEEIKAGLARFDLLDLAEKIAAEYRMPLDDVLDDNRAGTLPEVRGKLYGAIRKATGWSYPFIGGVVDRDHSSVRYSIERFAPECMGCGKLRAVRRRVKAITEAA